MTMVEIGNEELVPRIEKAIVNLKELREAIPAGYGQEDKVRLTNKIEGMEAILDAQRERFQNMKTSNDVITLAAMIEVGTVHKHREAVNLVQDYLMGYARD